MLICMKYDNYVCVYILYEIYIVIFIFNWFVSRFVLSLLGVSYIFIIIGCKKNVILDLF